MKTQNRYRVLVAGMVMQLCTGIIYGWSVFRGPVAGHLNWDPGAASLTSSIMLAMFVLGIIMGGYAQDKLGPKKATLAGSIMLGAGMASTAFISPDAPWLMYVTYGGVAGLGVGTVYTSNLAAVQKWFPDRRGFASGLIVSAFGFSLVVFAPLVKTMLDIIGVPNTFLILGIGFLLVCGTCSFLIQNPPQGYLPEGYIPAQSVVTKRQYAPKEIIKTRQYYLLTIALFFTLPAYFILNPVFLSLGIQRGLSDGFALLGVALTGISSSAGRLIISWLSDKTGRKAAMIVIAVTILTFTLIMIIAQSALFLICIMLISFSFGGAAGVYSAMTADSFGTKHGGMNYGLVMLGFGGSALTFPIIATKLTAGGNYTTSFIIAAAACVAAIILVSLMKNPNELSAMESQGYKQNESNDLESRVNKQNKSNSLESQAEKQNEQNRKDG